MSKNNWYKVTCTYDANSAKLVMTVDRSATQSCNALTNGINQVQFGRINLNNQPTPILHPASTFDTTNAAQLKFDDIPVTLR